VWRHLETIAPTIVYDAKVMWPFEVPVDELARIAVPTLALAGSKGAKEMLAAQEKIAASVPNSRHAVLAGQTHQVSAAVLAPVVDEFFTSLA
jgi:hypothetical protein